MGYRETFFACTPGVKLPFKRGTYYRCVSCKQWFTKSDITVDHIIPKRKGDSDDIWNLQPMCKHCNSSKRDRQTGFETAKSVLGATLHGDLDELVEGMAKQKVKDIFGIKYKRK